MKTAIILLCLFISVAIVVTAIIEHRKEDTLDQATIEGLKKQNAKERDSLNTQLAITRDSLSIALHTIALAHQESVEAMERSQRTIRDLQRIVYIKYESDSARLNAIKKLYPSYQ